MMENKKGLRPAKSADSSPLGDRAESEAATSKGRRKFLGQLAGTAAAAAASDLALGTKKAEAAVTTPNGTFAPLSESALRARRDKSLKGRINRAQYFHDVEFTLPLANDDEVIYPEKFANFTKSLPHDNLGHVDVDAYQALVDACTSGNSADFNAIPLGGVRPLRNPQGGLSFEFCGYDSNQTIIPPAPAFNSAWRAGEAVEVYWAALLRDVPFSEWATNPTVAQACADLSALSDYRGPKEGGIVTPNTIFRAPYPGATRGPWISQFLLKDMQYGSQPIVQQQRTFMPGIDYLKTYTDWLNVQNGAAAGARVFDPVHRYIRSLRDIACWVDADPPAQAGEYALMILLLQGTPFDSANPYFNGQITNQDAFTSLGPVEWFDMVGRAPRPAHEAAWFQKWRIHRSLRPEEFGGRVHNQKTGAFSYPLHPDVLNSDAVAETFAKQGTYLLSTAYPEGSPMHCAYPSGHSVGSGSTTTVLKAMFDETFTIPNPVQPNADGTALVPYVGPSLTVRGELNKLAWNIGWGRCGGGIHWRTDVIQGNYLGQQMSIGVLRDMKESLKEPYAGYTLTNYNGAKVQI